MRSTAQILALHVQAQRGALAMVTGTAVFALVIITAFTAERQQARQDILMQEMRGTIAGDHP